MALSIPDKPSGARYTVTMYDPNLSPHDIVMGLIRGGTAPIPAMPARCVCCEAATERRQRMNLSTDRLEVTPIEVLVCDKCAGHAFIETFWGYVAGWSAAMMIAVVCIGIGLDSPALVFLAGALALCLITIVILMVRHRRERAHEGHHALAVRVTPGKTVVKTTNRQLVVAIVDLNPKLVHYVL